MNIKTENKEEKSLAHDLIHADQENYRQLLEEYLASASPNHPKWKPIAPFENVDATDTKRVLLTQSSVASIGVSESDPNIAYCAVEPEGTLFKTRDGGQSWHLIDFNFHEKIGRDAIAVDPQDSSHVYVGGADHIWHSKNGGDDWSVFYRHKGMGINSIALGILNGNTIVVVGGKGGSWTFWPRFVRPNPFHTRTDTVWDVKTMYIPTNPPTGNYIPLFVCISSKGGNADPSYVYISDSFGESWKPLDKGWYVPKLKDGKNLTNNKLAISGTTIYALLLGTEESTPKEDYYQRFLGIWKMNFDLHGENKWELTRDHVGPPYDRTIGGDINPLWKRPNVPTEIVPSIISNENAPLTVVMVASPEDPDVLYVGAAETLYMSNNGGKGFVQMSTGLDQAGIKEAERTLNSLKVVPNGKGGLEYWVAINGGVAKSPDGLTYKPFSRGLYMAPFTNGAIHPTEDVISLYWKFTIEPPNRGHYGIYNKKYGNGVVVEYNPDYTSPKGLTYDFKGATFLTTNTRKVTQPTEALFGMASGGASLVFPDPGSLEGYPVRPSEWRGDFPNGLTAGGGHFPEGDITFTPNYSEVALMSYSDPEKGLSTIQRTTDNGEHIEVLEHSSLPLFVYCPNILFSTKSSAVYLNMMDPENRENYIFVSYGSGKDLGTNWEEVPVPGKFKSGKSLITLDTVTDTLYTTLLDASGEVYKTSDDGKNWEPVVGPDPNIGTVKFLCFVQGSQNDDLYLATTNGIYYYSQNLTGGKWQPYNQGFPDIEIGKINVTAMNVFYPTNKLRIVSNIGVWEVDLCQTPENPVAIPVVARDTFKASETLQFMDGSYLEREGASWQWEFEPTPKSVSSLTERNPTVVPAENSSSLKATLTVTNKLGNSDSKEITLERE